MRYNEQFDQYIQLLGKWNRSINLIQKDSMDSIYERHIKDSMQICDLLSKDECIIDVGSGAGFPGVVLAICGFENIVLCEKNLKKTVFLRDVRSKLGLKFEIFNDDICKFKESGFTAVSRAFGSLGLLLETMLAISSPKGVFHKGESYEDEIRVAKELFDFEYKFRPSATNKESVIIAVSGVKRK